MFSNLALKAPIDTCAPKRTLRFAKTSLTVAATALLLAAGAMAQPVETVLHNLHSGRPGGRLIFDAKGNLYGTNLGFRGTHGTVFELRHQKLRWTYKLLYRFTGGTDGADPQPGLVFDSAGNLYGTTPVGGTKGCNWSKLQTCGTVFELIPTPKGQWTEKIVYSFPGGAGPSIPSTGLIADASGNFYGGTIYGGPNNFDGTVFRLAPQPDGSRSYQQLYAFTSANTFGMNVQGPLTIDKAGNLYGATPAGGSGASCPDPTNGCGTVFQLSPNPVGSWTYNSLYSFCSLPNCADGQTPIGVVPDDQGNLYGTASSNGGQSENGGTAFELAAGTGGKWTFTLLYSFCSLPSCADGASPSGALIRDPAGNLYGPTILGGTSNQGTVFELSHGPGGLWNRQSLYDFCQSPRCADGLEPAGELTLDSSGNLYGTTGSNAIFQIIP